MDGGSLETSRVKLRKFKVFLAQPLEIQQDFAPHLDVELRIFATNVKLILLYGCETWKITQSNNRLGVRCQSTKINSVNFRHIDVKVLRK